MINRIFLFLATFLLISSCSFDNNTSKNSNDKQVKEEQNFQLTGNNNPKYLKLTILHTNDHHGHFWKNKHGEFGIAARMTLIKELRQQAWQEGRMVILLSGGDINTGVPESDLLKAKPDFLGMNQMKYDAMVLGNHEFDNPFEQLLEQQSWVSFPFLSANIFYKDKENERPFLSHMTKQQNEVRVTIVGFTSDDTPKIALQASKYLNFQSPVEVAKKLVPKLKKESDILIALTHMGYYKNGEHKNKAPGDVTLAKSVEGIDLIIGGHSHDSLSTPDIQNNTIIVQAQEWGKYVGKVDLTYENGKLSLEQYELIPVNLKKKIEKDGKQIRVFVDKEIPEDPEMLELLEPYKQKGSEKLDIVIGRIDGDLNGDSSHIRSGETNMGNFFTYAMKDIVNADIAISNSGGIRASLEAGEVTYRDILTVHPFGNTIVTLSITGSELLEYLTEAISQPPSGAFAQMSGVEIVAIEDGDKMKIETLLINGTIVKENQKYKLAINSFISMGGDGYPNMQEHPTYMNTGITMDQALKTLFDNKGGVIKVDEFKATSN